MPTDVIMPQMGESIAEETATKWLKKVGERVARDEVLLEISTDKVDGKVLVKENERVAVNPVVSCNRLRRRQSRRPYR
jgi:pyruvate/2-oxoglutarate dehydrogenase complex dihydrolipoamide acyltransferase (E2) component